MLIQLTEDVYEDDSRNRLKTTVRFDRGIAFQWTKGRCLHVSEATGAKLIERGVAEKVDTTTET